VPADRGARPLLVEINGDVVALISFRPSERLEGAEAIRRLTSTRRVPVILATDRSRAEVSSLAASLGVNQVRGDLTPSAKAEFVRSYRLRGLKAAFVGDCSDHAIAPAAAEAFIAISIPRAPLSTTEAREYPSPAGSRRSQSRSGGKDKRRRASQPMAPSARSFATDPLHPSGGPDRDEAFLISDPGPASVQILSDRLDRLELLWEIAGARSRRIRRDQTVIAVPNVFAAAGALLFGFTSYHSILLTNLGTYTAYNLAKGPNQPRDTLSLASPRGRSESRSIAKR
jgi:hypothetical protein